MNEEQNEVWTLSKIELEIQTYGEHKGKYIGKIRFSNGKYEGFNFNIYPEMAEDYISLIKDTVLKSSQELTEKLIKTLNIKNK